MEATTKDLRLHTEKLISAAQRGEEVVITFRGKPSARLVPLEEPAESMERKRNPGFGMWADNNDLSVDDEVRSRRAARRFEEC